MRVVELLLVRDLAVSPEVLWPWVSDAEHISQWASVSITPLPPPARWVRATREVRMGALHMEERAGGAGRSSQHVATPIDGSSRSSSLIASRACLGWEAAGRWSL